MPENNDDKYRQFDKVLQAAHHAFLRYEDEHLRDKSAPETPAATRAAQFNTFVLENPEFAVLKRDISPDICERYLQQYHYVTSPTDQGPEPEDGQQRNAAAIAIYSEFRSNPGFKGTRPAEILAFQQFVEMKYPNTLPDFTEKEAEAVIGGWRSKRHTTYAGYLLGLVLLAGLGGVLYSVSSGPEKLQRRPTTPKIKEKDDFPLLRPRDDNQNWRPPIFNPLDPLQQPPSPEAMEKIRKILEQDQQDRLKRFGENPKGREPGR